jgi:hypothetical protein
MMRIYKTKKERITSERRKLHGALHNWAESVGWIKLALDRFHWPYFVNTVMNL